MYCSTHSTPPLISKPSFLGCIGVSNIRGPMGLKKWLGGSAPCWSSCPTSQHPSDWTGCRKGRPGSWWLFPLRWCPHKKVMFGDRVWRDRNVLYISHRLVMSFWISESRVIHGMAHDFLLLQSVPLYAKDHPRPWMRWMFERKKISRHRNIETGQPVVLLFSSSWWGQTITWNRSMHAYSCQQQSQPLSWSWKCKSFPVLVVDKIRLLIG